VDTGREWVTNEHRDRSGVSFNRPGIETPTALLGDQSGKSLFLLLAFFVSFVAKLTCVLRVLLGVS
jgi:hypothetical protein